MQNAADAPSVESDRTFCEGVLPHVSRTFALSVSLLPPPLRDSVGTAYLLCRIADCIEDEHEMASARREQLFDTFVSLMTDDWRDPLELEQESERANLGGHDRERELMRGAGAIFRRFRRLTPAEREAIRPYVLEMASGMREYAGREGLVRIGDLDDLERYCYYVAGTVGGLLTDLFTLDLGIEPAATQHARSVRFGLGLQLVNIAKDVAEDAARGVSFVPRTLAESQGLEVHDMLDPRYRELAQAIVEALCDRASEHLTEAEAYTLAWPEREAAHVRLFCAVPIALAWETLALLKSGVDGLTPGQTPKMTRQAVETSVEEARAGCDSDAALTALFRRARRVGQEHASAGG